MLVRVISWQMNDHLFTAVSCYELETVKAIGGKEGPSSAHSRRNSCKAAVPKAGGL
jgi:hypothetical protein